MMRTILLATLMLLFSNFLLGQFSYESDDFAHKDEVIIYTNAISTDPSIDFALKGENVAWNYENLLTIGADTVLYFDPNDAGYRFYYCFANAFIFNCQSKFDELTNLAELSVDSFAVGDFRTSNITRHYHLSEDEFSETMLGVTAELGGIDVPVAVDFEARDVILQFPLSYGNVDSSESRLVIDLNDVGFNAGLARNRKRTNIVEGYGSLVTPARSYDQVLKVKSIIYNADTTILDDMRIPINSIEVEYKWYSFGLSGHVMKASGNLIAGNEVITQVQYNGMENVVSTSDQQIAEVEIYPNPFYDVLHVRSEEVTMSSYELVNQQGQSVLKGYLNSDRIKFVKELNPGHYFLILMDDEGTRKVKKVVRL